MTLDAMEEHRRVERQGRSAIYKQRHTFQRVHGSACHQQHAEWLGIGIYALRDGKIVDAWFGEDMLGLLLQLGALTLPIV